ncbi:uncharacterized protein LOC142333183 isoform X2 [Lycorma delicatula]|uniref:uncharacterized protein LOC142333183 isoform X2 n=1 Tax=Lycorma delicatula TaxID=130591 RepID=UPI003F50E8E7
MFLKQGKWSTYIVTIILFTEVLPFKMCVQYRNGKKTRKWRSQGYTEEEDIQIYSYKFCSMYNRKPIEIFCCHFFTSCAKRAAEYLKIVGENKEDIKSYAAECKKTNLNWNECLDIMFDLATKCWDMANATYLLQLINDKKLIMSLPKLIIEVSYTKVLYLKNFEPKLCIEDIMGSLTVRYAFENNYYKWFQSNPTAKGCDCKKVITLYYKYKIENIPLDTNIFSHECL